MILYLWLFLNFIGTSYNSAPQSQNNLQRYVSNAGISKFFLQTTKTMIYIYIYIYYNLGGTQIGSSSTGSCNQQQSLPLTSTSPSVSVQGNIWQVNIVQVSGSPVPVNTIQIDTRGLSFNGYVSLTLIDANQQQYGPYQYGINSGGSLILQNIPSIPINMFKLQFPDGVQSNNYLVTIILCPQTNTPSSASMLTFF